MLSHAAPPHVPTDGRTASGDPLNGPRYQLPTAQSWIGRRPRWTRGKMRHFRASGLSPAALLSPQRAGSTSHLGNVGLYRFEDSTVHLDVYRDIAGAKAAASRWAGIELGPWHALPIKTKRLLCTGLAKLAAPDFRWRP